MKKIIMTLALVVAVGFAGLNVAEAYWGGGWMMGGSGAGRTGYMMDNTGYGYGCNGPGGWTNTSLTYEDMDKFHTDTAELRKQMFEKRTAYYDAVNAETPDKDLAKKLWSEMFDLQNQMHEKALASGMMRGYVR